MAQSLPKLFLSETKKHGHKFILGRSGIWELGTDQGDQIGRNFAIWAIFMALGDFFLEKIAQ